MDLSLKNSKLKEDMKKLTFLSLVFITAFLTAQKPNVLFLTYAFLKFSSKNHHNHIYPRIQQ